MNKKSSVTPLILIVVMVAALYAISVRVNTPPPQPPKVTPPPPPVSPADSQKRQMTMQHKMAQEAQKSMAAKMHGNKPAKPRPNPYSINVSDNYWFHGKMGVTGIKAERAKVKQEEAWLKAHPLAPPMPPPDAGPPGNPPVASPGKTASPVPNPSTAKAEKTK